MVSGRVTWILAAVAAAAYAALWLGHVSGWGWLVAGDDDALRTAYAFGVHRPAWVEFWNAVSVLLGPTALRILAIVVIIVALLNRRPWIAAFLTVTVLAMGLVTVVAKAAADRPRPSTALVAAGSSSFPSGHALGIMVGVLAFLAVLAPRIPRPARVWAVAAGAGAVLLVGVARVVLNVHHPSDVLAGWALGYLWFLVCVTVVPPRRQPAGRGPATP